MNDIKRTLNEFFDAYESRMNKAIGQNPVIDIDATVDAFADYFVESSPVGVSGGKNDNEFRKLVPQGFEFYRTVGTQSMTTRSRTLSQIDELHWMVHQAWRAIYLKRDKTQDVIDFDVFYFVTVAGETPKIFAFITGDEQRVMREHGLIPNPQPADAQPA